MGRRVADDQESARLTGPPRSKDVERGGAHKTHDEDSDASSKPDFARKRATAPVALVRTQAERESVFAAVRQAMERAGWQDFITPGADVALKPSRVGQAHPRRD